MNVVFLGASNPHTVKMIQAIKQSDPNFKVYGFIDNDPAKKDTEFVGYPVFGGFEILDALKEDVHFVNLITQSTKLRHETSLTLASKGCRFTNFIHPSIDLTMVKMGTDIYLQEQVVVQTDVEIGNHCAAHLGALITHQVQMGDSVFIAPGCSVLGCVTIGKGAYLGSNSVILPHLHIGKWSTVGAGAVIIEDVPDYATVVGNPGRIVKIGGEE